MSINISIHAPREGGDFFRFIGVVFKRYFNPRPPRGGRLLRQFIKQTDNLTFQSTPPARGATPDTTGGHQRPSISIHAPREGGDFTGFGIPDIPALFQSTPPARGATPQKHHLSIDDKFQSTPPARGATEKSRSSPVDQAISIHAPREGGDRKDGKKKSFTITFQSTPPARGATYFFSQTFDIDKFQSTPPARGATAKMHSFTCGSLTNK